MSFKLKTLWLNLGFLDREMDLSERWQILQALAKQDVEVRASFNYLQKPLAIEGLDRVWMLPFRAPELLGALILFFEQQLLLLKNLDVDVVVVWPFNLHQTLPIWFVWRRLLGNRFPKFVVDFRTLPVDMPRNWRGRLREKRFDNAVQWAFGNFDGVTIITNKMKKDLQTKANNFHKELCVWATGVDPDRFDPDRLVDFRIKLGFKGRFVIMYHGILSPNRGLQAAVEAIDIVRNAHPQVLLFFLGKGPAEPLLRERIRSLGVQDHVVVHPPVSYEDVPTYINSSQVGILPFPDLEWWNTSSPIKLNEYLAMGKPVIVTDIAAHRAVVGDEEFAFYVTNDLPKNLAKGMEAVMAKKNDLPQLAKRARALALKKLTWQVQATKIKAYFEKLANGKPPVRR